MPRCCSVFGCNSNYKSQKEAVSTFSLPKDERLRKEWLRRIPTDFSKLKSPVVCVKHFTADSVIRTEQFIVDGEIKIFERSYPKLKPNAVPSLFPGLHDRFSSPGPSCRRLADVEEDRISAAIVASLKDYKEYEGNNMIHSLHDIVEYFASIKSNLKGQWVCIESKDNLIMCLLDVSGNIPSVSGSVYIGSDLCASRFSMNEISVSQDKLPAHILSVNKKTIVLEMLEYIERQVKDKEAHKVFVVNHVEKTLQETFSNEDCSQLKFLIEQIKFLVVTENNRRYSGNTLVFAASMYIHSSSAYRTLYESGYMFLPHPRNLQILVGKFDLNSFNIDGAIDYLKIKKDSLKEHELLVNIILDEIYIHPQMTFKGGSVYGMCNSTKNSNAENGELAKTAQVFMISSVHSQYKDVVSIVPVLNLRSDQLKSMLLRVIEKVENIGFVVLSLVSDNNSVNRRAFELFTENNTLQPYVDHPMDNGRKLFMIFDTVHILKSIRNAWITRRDRCFVFPSFDNFQELVRADFRYLELLYKKEKDLLVKYGHLLSYKVLNPTSIQRQNVNLALKIFDERNIAVLKCMINKELDFKGCECTVSFMQIICNWWHIVNVKCAYEGVRFNCAFREPIRKDSIIQIEYLKKISLWLKNWRLSVPSAQGLTPQTFQSLTHTIDAFLLLIPYVFEKYKVDYILLSKYQSDNIEARFSSYRQLSGANYFISYVQVLEAERKLRFKDTLSLFSLNQDVPLKSLLPCSDKLNNSASIEKYEDVLEQNFSFSGIDNNTMSILIYITGYAVKRELFQKKCDVCTVWVQNDRELEISVSSDFLTEYDRGKLNIPTVNSSTATGLAWFLMRNILSLHSTTFLSDVNQLSILFKLCCLKLESCAFENLCLDDYCACKRTARDLLQNICIRSCRVLLNNVVKQKNDNVETTNRCKRQMKKLKST